ncbi:MAG: guanylate kinase [Thermoleophilia bacterium]|nr:guanylate kinase [Thermoleophilia bacterium]
MLPRFAGRLRVAVSATTRSMRPGEVDGREYHFMDPARFTRLVAEGAFLEHVVYAGNHYGTLKGEVDRITAEGVSCVVEIELRGARAVRRALPGCVTVFIAPPSMAELAKRLDERGTDSPEEIATRLEVGREELAAIHEFDHHIVNVEVERAVDDLADVVARETACRPDAG